jgi:hypothetical protein
VLAGIESLAILGELDDGGRMASHYTKSADRERLAARAMQKLARNEK